MCNSKQILSSLAKSCQLSQAELEQVLDFGPGPKLRRTLDALLLEYRNIENELYALASRRGWELPEPDPAIGFLAGNSLRIRLNRHISESRVADILIRSCTKRMIRDLRTVRQNLHDDDPLQILSQKLLDCETAGLRQLQNYI